MTTTPIDSLFDGLDTGGESGTKSINASLWFEDRDGYRIVFLRHEILYRLSLDDPVHLALVCVTLRQSELASQSEIASAFGHSVATQRRWETHYKDLGIDGLQHGSPSGRPAKLNAGQMAFIRRWFHQGLSNREIAKRLSVSEMTIRRVLSSAGLHRQTPAVAELPFDASVSAPAATADAALSPDSVVASATPPDAPASLANPVSVAAPPALAAVTSAPACVLPAHEVSPLAPEAVPCQVDTVPCPQAAHQPVTRHPADDAPARVYSVDTDPSDRSGDRALARMGLLQDVVPLFDDHQELPRAGVLLAIPVLQEHGGLEVFVRLYDSLGPAFYGPRTTLLSLILLALLRVKRPENVKEYSPQQLGALVGLDRMPEVKTLRRKLTLLAERGKARELMCQLARARIERDEDRLAFLYIDGHVREYTGKAELAKAKKAQRSVATTAATDTWVADSAGEPLLVFNSDMNEGLTQMLEEVVAQAKELVPAGKRLTVLFDRGGWSPKLFARLQRMGVDVITYKKGKRKEVPQSRFSEHKVAEGNQEQTYWLYDQPRTRVGRLRPHRKRRRAGDPEFMWMRQITLLREDGGQTVIVTNRTDLPAVEVVQRLFRRWRQENYFKYMAEEFALDALAEYAVEDVDEEMTRPNPQRKQVDKELGQVKAEVKQLLAQLGAEVEANEEQQRRTMRGFKIAQAQLRRQLEEEQQRQRELQEKRGQLPERVPAEGLKKLKAEKKRIVDVIKMMAYQVETELLDKLRSHYKRTQDEGRTLLHAAFQSSAKMEVTETELRITLAAQSSPHRSEALAMLCRDLNAANACYPGTSLRLRYAVEGQEPLTD